MRQTSDRGAAVPNEAARSIMDILNGGPERRLFETAEEVRAYLAEEKAAWHED